MRRVVGLSTLLLLSFYAYAETGDLKAVVPTPGEARSKANLYASGGNFSPRRADDGTVSPQAVIATMQSGSPSVPTLKVAVDSQSPDAKAPDLLRLDFTGQGKFQDKPTVPLGKGAEPPGTPTMHIPPTTVQVQRGKESIPVAVSGLYYKFGDGARYLNLTLSTAVEGECRFGDKTFRVKVIDGDGNLHCGDKVRAQSAGGPILGDTLIVYAADKSPAESYYGHPALVDGVWYDVSISEDGKRVSAAPAKVETAKLKIDHLKWTIVLSGTHILRLSGSSKPVDIPAGSYKIVEFTQQAEQAGDKNKPVALLVARGGAKPVTIAAKAGETVELAIGTPLKGYVEATVLKGAVQMNFHLVDAAGLDVLAQLISGSGPNSNPQVDVLDADGKSVHSGKFEYG